MFSSVEPEIAHDDDQLAHQCYPEWYMCYWAAPDSIGERVKRERWECARDADLVRRSGTGNDDHHRTKRLSEC